MLTPAEFIEALRRRQLRSIRPQPAGGMPSGWQAWLEGAGGRAALAGYDAGELVSLVAERGISPRAETGTWWPLTPLWLRGWEPPRRDERGLRMAARTLSFVLHLGLVLMLSWLMHARFVTAPAADAQRGEHVIEVEFIGTGTPEEDGGGDNPGQAATPEEPEADPTPVSPQPSPQEAATPPVAHDPAEPAVSPHLAPPPPAEQPLVVTETEQPEGPFQLPPIPAVELEAPALRSVEVAPRSREIELAETAQLAGPPIVAREPEPREPTLPEVRIQEREIVLPPAPQSLPLPTIAAPPVEAPVLEAPVRSARVRDVPMPPAQGPAPAAEQATAEPAPAREATADSSPNPGDPGERPAPGRGPAPTPQEGGWASRMRDDDWGDSTRERAGGQLGTSNLFNPDGSPRLPGEGQVGGGLPPGTITEDYERIDRMGTWLKRPPTDYEPTSFDRFWVPHESLLQEWVRRSVRTVLIPIPGTGKSIRCDVVTLAIAGGCGIVDPNLQDNPASARPPPDVPFRPELHEDQEGLSDDVWD